MTVDPPTRPIFEGKAKREGPAASPAELSIEFERACDESESGGDDTDGGLGDELSFTKSTI